MRKWATAASIVFIVVLIGLILWPKGEAHVTLRHTSTETLTPWSRIQVALDYANAPDDHATLQDYEVNFGDDGHLAFADVLLEVSRPGEAAFFVRAKVWGNDATPSEARVTLTRTSESGATSPRSGSGDVPTSRFHWAFEALTVQDFVDAFPAPGPTPLRGPRIAAAMHCWANPGTGGNWDVYQPAGLGIELVGLNMGMSCGRSANPPPFIFEFFNYCSPQGPSCPESTPQFVVAPQ